MVVVVDGSAVLQLTLHLVVVEAVQAVELNYGFQHQNLVQPKLLLLAVEGLVVLVLLLAIQAETLVIMGTIQGLQHEFMH